MLAERGEVDRRSPPRPPRRYRLLDVTAGTSGQRRRRELTLTRMPLHDNRYAAHSAEWAAYLSLGQDGSMTSSAQSAQPAAPRRRHGFLRQASAAPSSPTWRTAATTSRARPDPSGSPETPFVAVDLTDYGQVVEALSAASTSTRRRSTRSCTSRRSRPRACAPTPRRSPTTRPRPTTSSRRRARCGSAASCGRRARRCSGCRSTLPRPTSRSTRSTTRVRSRPTRSTRRSRRRWRGTSAAGTPS